MPGKFETKPLLGNLCNKNGLNVQMNKGDITFERLSISNQRLTIGQNWKTLWLSILVTLLSLRKSKMIFLCSPGPTRPGNITITWRENFLRNEPLKLVAIQTINMQFLHINRCIFIYIHRGFKTSTVLIKTKFSHSILSRQAINESTFSRSSCGSASAIHFCTGGPAQTTRSNFLLLISLIFIER